MIAIGLASILAAVAYTAGPWPYGYHGLGDLFVFVFFGVLAVAGTFRDVILDYLGTTEGGVTSFDVFTKSGDPALSGRTYWIGVAYVKIEDAVDHLNLNVEGSGDDLVFTWKSQAGMRYDLLSVVDPSSTDPKDWPIYDGNMDLTPTPPTNTLTIPLPPETIRLFVVEEFPAPPVTVFSDNFEDGQGDWTTGGDDGSNPFTNWEFGSPTVVGPASPNSGANCFGTNLSADYANDSDLWLRSPPIDLTAAAEATLNFSHYVDIEEGFDFGEVRLLDADAALAELAVLEMTIDGNNPTGWEPFSKALPAAALGKNVVLEFRFDSDDISEPTQAGWYIDDVVVTTPAP